MKKYGNIRKDPKTQSHKGFALEVEDDLLYGFTPTHWW